MKHMNQQRRKRASTNGFPIWEKKKCYGVKFGSPAIIMKFVSSFVSPERMTRRAHTKVELGAFEEGNKEGLWVHLMQEKEAALYLRPHRWNLRRSLYKPRCSAVRCGACGVSTPYRGARATRTEPKPRRCDVPAPTDTVPHRLCSQPTQGRPLDHASMQKLLSDSI